MVVSCRRHQVHTQTQDAIKAGLYLQVFEVDRAVFHNNLCQVLVHTLSFLSSTSTSIVTLTSSSVSAWYFLALQLGGHQTSGWTGQLSLSLVLFLRPTGHTPVAPIGPTNTFPIASLVTMAYSFSLFSSPALKDFSL